VYFVVSKKEDEMGVVERTITDDTLFLMKILKK